MIARHHDSAWRQIAVALAIVALLAFPQFGWLSMGVYPLVGIALCACALAADRASPADVGLDLRRFAMIPFLSGVALGLAFAAVNYWLVGPALARALGERPDLSAFGFVRTDRNGYLRMLLASWLVGGLYEEFVFRGVIFHALRSRFAADARGWTAAALITSALFAAYHVQLGTFGMANAFIGALAISGLQLRWPRNLWPLIAFHAVGDCVAFTLIRYGWL